MEIVLKEIKQKKKKPKPHTREGSCTQNSVRKLCNAATDQALGVILDYTEEDRLCRALSSYLQKLERNKK